MKPVNDAHSSNSIASSSQNSTLELTVSATTSVHNADEIQDIDAELSKSSRNKNVQSVLEDDENNSEIDVACLSLEELEAKRFLNVVEKAILARKSEGRCILANYPATKKFSKKKG